jgi:hypothetical protein
VERPASFDEEFMQDWSLWVLDHGLPALPGTLGANDSVPVARWVGPRWGGVFHVNWWRSDQPGEPDEPDCDIEVFRRGESDWEPASGSGGSNWYSPPLSRPQVPPRYAAFGGTTYNGGEGGWWCCALDGLVGVEADTVEVEDADGLTKNRLESQLGVVLVAVDGTRPATIRVRDSAGEVLTTEHFDGIDIGPPVEAEPEGSGISLTPHYTPIGRLRSWVKRFGGS